MKKNFLYGSMALGLLCASCSSDEIIENGGNSSAGAADSDQAYYVSMRISGDVSGTESRASSVNGNPDEGTNGDFADGTVEENKVSTAYFVFYDNDGNVIGDVVPVDLPAPDKVAAPGGTVDVSYKSVVRVDVRKGESNPSQVICYLNPVNPGSLNRNLDAIQTVARENFRNGDGNFAMSNAVFYPNGAQQPQIATVIPSTQLYKSETEAKAAADANDCVSIYVERYAAKLKFNAVEPEAYQTASRVYTATDTYTANPVVLSFKPQKWALNAESKSTYVIKSLREESTDGQILPNNYTYNTLNGRINAAYGADGNSVNVGTALGNGQWVWNNAAYHRSYWGMSPAFYTSKYPEVSSDLEDMEVNQIYWSYNQVLNGTNASGNPIGKTNNTTHYFKETTVGYNALNSTNPAAAVASVIYVGSYELTVNGTPVPAGTGFYSYLNGPVTIDGEEVDRPYIYFNGADITSGKVSGGESMLKRFLIRANIIVKKNAEGEFVPYSVFNQADLNKLTNIFEVAEISKEVKQAYDGNNNTELKLQANSRTLQLKKGVTSTDLADIYILSANGYNTITTNATSGEGEITLTEANVALMRQVGLSYYYNAGHAYFNIPVKHLGWYRTANRQKDDATINWNIVRVGDFGVVRNHSYSIQVNNILGLASGIGNDDTPIVPPVTPDNLFMAYTVNILRWAVVPVQNVDL